MWHKKLLKIALIILLILIAIYFTLSSKNIPQNIQYGVSFSKLHSDELNLDWQEVYRAILYDLKVKNLRLSAHWPMIEPQDGKFIWKELDFQIDEASKANASVILSVGRRLPVWPECHEPDWVRSLSWEEKKKHILSIVNETVSRYKYFQNIKYWQVENEPFLEIFAKENCGELDKDFLKEEIALVKTLDPIREILVTDSGNLGKWYGAWKMGDLFGTSVYIYLWNPQVGEIRSILWPGFYRAKTRFMEIFAGKKESLLIELSLEPWLLSPIREVSINEQLERMDTKKFAEVIKFARDTNFEKQYLWGPEWWYWMKKNNHPEFWEMAKDIFKK